MYHVHIVQLCIALNVHELYNRFIFNLCIIILFIDEIYYLQIYYLCVIRAPDKLRICVFYAMKTSKNACISDQSVHLRIHIAV